MKKILVAGGAGFIGSNLCERLLKEKNQVTCVDNLSTGDKKNIAPLLSKSRFQFFNLNICDEKAVQRLEAKFDEIYHLASPASVTCIMERPIEVALVNSVGTNNLLKLALKNKAKLLFTSSSEAYGDPKEHPQKESYRGNTSSVGVRSGYDEGKRFGEALCMAYYRELGANVKIIRIFNTYGQNSSIQDTRVIPQFVTQALLGKPLTVHGDGQQTRSFCYVSDMVDGLIKMMRSDELGPINLGNPDECKIIELAKKVIEMTKSTSKITFVNRPEDDPSIRQPDISLAKSKLSWDSRISLDQGLKMTIDYFKKVLQK